MRSSTWKAATVSIAETRTSEAALTDPSDSETATSAAEVAYHLHLDGEEPALAAQALRLLISDEAHEPQIRKLAREVLAELDQEPPAGEPLVVALTPGGMKITHTALKLLLDDLRRDQADTRQALRTILEKLPDEHAIRAIVLD
jgi:hypothetical protein